MSQTLNAAHRQWAIRPKDERYETLTALYEAVRLRRSRSLEGDVKREELQKMRVTVGTDGALLIGGHHPSHWSFGQVSGLVGAPAEYLRELSPNLAAENLNEGIHTRLDERESGFKLLVSGSNGGSVLRAVTSQKYGRVWDEEVVKVLLEHAEGFKNPPAFEMKDDGSFGPRQVPSGLYASDRDVFAFLVNDEDRIDMGGGRTLARGFYAWNSETGRCRFGFTKFLHDYVCGNHYVWGAEEVETQRFRHVGEVARKGLLETFPQAIELLRKRGGKMAEEQKLREAAAETLAKNDKEAVEVLLKSGFTRVEAAGGVDAAVREERNPFTRFGLVAGLTAYARTIPYMDKKVDLETRAGALLPSLN